MKTEFKVRRKSFNQTIIDELYRMRDEAKTNKHYTHGDFNNVQSVQYALNNAIAMVKCEIQSRKLGTPGYSAIGSKKLK